MTFKALVLDWNLMGFTRYPAYSTVISNSPFEGGEWVVILALNLYKMKHVILIIALLAFYPSDGQDVKSFKPHKIKILDFGPEVQAEWEIRDKALEALENGDKSWEELSKSEKEIFERHEEVYKNIWDIVGGGCSWYCGGGPRLVSASTYLKSQGNISYAPENAHDLDYKNAWVEGAVGYGIGEYLKYEFAPESPRITDVIVVNGYVKSITSYQANSRVKKLLVYYNDEPFGILELEDKVAEQSYKIGPFGYDDRSDFESLKLKDPWTLKFEILEVYKGAKYDDTVISEIFFDGIDVH